MIRHGFRIAALVVALPAVVHAYEAQLDLAPTEDALLCFAFAAGTSQAVTHTVGPGESIQAAIDAAQNGDVISVAPGIYDEDITFNGKAVRVLGAGPTTIIRGTGTGSVVRFNNGESSDSVLDSVMVTGGNAVNGGGIFISNASPTVIRTVIKENRAVSAGSGIYLGSNADARVYNNLVIYNTTSGGDPHGIQIFNSSPIVVNNTIALQDSNGMLISGTSFPQVVNNIFALNGDTGPLRGRGICDFSGNRAEIRYNDFYRNRIAALLRGGRDWRRVSSIQAGDGDPMVTDNIDTSPGNRFRPQRRPERAALGDFDLRAGRRASAIHAGDPDPGCDNLDGTRNTMGHTGGPFAPGSSALPGAGACGMP